MTKEQNYVNEQIRKYIKLIPEEKYHHPGVYSITVGDEIVYVGKARDMRTRIAAHMYNTLYGEHKTEGMKFKYGELKRAIKNGYGIKFDVLYTSSYSCNTKDKKVIDDDIGPQEAKYINQYMPKLNKQIPDLNNYHKYKNKNYELLNIQEKKVFLT